MTPPRRERPAIQRLHSGDAARLRALRLRSLRDAPDAFGGSYEESAARSDEDWERQLAELATFVAVVDGADAGLVRGIADPTREDAALLLSMWVAPEARGTGAGDALIAALVAWARAEGFARLLLDVGDENLPAIRLYARNGFEPTGATSTLPAPREHITEHERQRVL